MSSKVLSHDLFGKGSRAAIWLHGILGHKRNLRQISKRLLRHNNEIMDCSITAASESDCFLTCISKAAVAVDCSECPASIRAFSVATLVSIASVN